MISFFLTLIRLIKALVRGLRDPEFRAVVILAMLLILSGGLFYRWAEGWTFLDAIYFSVITLSTVGYGDLYPVTPIGKVFTIMYILVGIGVFVTLVTLMAKALLIDTKIERKADSSDADTSPDDKTG
ncbi:potassium channel family protein [Defluviimonas sp. WL0050]|uniref:Potassium channel family protein n=1 Tax=Albidovulum litorale TaxID=2984134 RepID=A0ABT2ZP04_9RHOB|nr:potassium channel family protein [Defluviimonas sp. WL0050]MCV2872870.1 potassium channel family protein [Defluviimonas sp. WL0050]